MQPLKVGTDFSGLGSPEEALKRLGVKHTVEFACERDKYARQSYLANHSPKVFYDDVTTRDNSKAGYVDMYVFGFPCQAFSNAGKRLGFQDTRGTLFFNSLDYINQNRPRVFIAENVKGLLSHDKKKGTKGKYGNTFNTIIDCLAVTANGQYNLHKYDDCVNYHVVYAVLNTKNYGIPQNRERIFIVGFRDEQDAINYRTPKGFELRLKLKDMLQDNPDSRYYFDTITHRAGVINWRENENSISGFRDDARSSGMQEEVYHKADGILNTLTTAHIPKLIEVDEKYYLSDKMLAGLLACNDKHKEKGNGFEFKPKDGEGLASCITARVFKMGVDDNYIQVKEATKQGYATATAGDSVNISHQKSTTRKGRVGKQIANTIDTASTKAVVVPELKLFGNIEGNNEMRTRVYDIDGISPTVTAVQGGGHEPKVFTGYRIRRLTPRECFRLMGYTDEFFDQCQAIQSDTQLYKQAGNSIVVDTILQVIKNIMYAIGYELDIAA